MKVVYGGSTSNLKAHLENRKSEVKHGLAFHELYGEKEGVKKQAMLKLVPKSRETSKEDRERLNNAIYYN